MTILSSISMVFGFLRQIFGWIGNVVGFIYKIVLRKKRIRKKIYEESKDDMQKDLKGNTARHMVATDNCIKRNT